MRLLVDGHNLIGQMPNIRLDDPYDEAKLAVQLKQYCMRYHKHCTLVFDNGLPGGFSKLSNSLVTVIFAPRGSTADQLIIRRIRTISDPASVTVITSDRAIVSEAQRRNMPVIRSPEFVQMLNAPAQALLDDAADEDPNPIITADEVSYWLSIFGERTVTLNALLSVRKSKRKPRK